MATDWNNTQDVMLKRQKAIDAGYKAEDVDAFIKQQKDNAAMMELAKQGVVNVADIAKTNPQLAQKAINQGAEPKKAMSADEEKKQRSKDLAERIVTQLEEQYYQGQETPELASGRVGGLFQDLLSKAGYNPKLKIYNATVASDRPILARAAGEVGALTEAEQEAAIKQLPSAYSTADEANLGFQELRKRLGLKPKTSKKQSSGRSKYTVEAVQ